MSDNTIESFEGAMVEEVSRLLARAFVTNPINVAAFGTAELSLSEVFFRSSLPLMKGTKLVARDSSRIVGFIHWVNSPRCQLSGVEKLAMLPNLLRHFGVRRAVRISSWLSTWSTHDPDHSHAHLGPIGVDPDFQARGIGRQLMIRYCSELDRQKISGYLETDRSENVAFYQRFGFKIVSERSVLGVQNYFMVR
jgi:ribosomal protein S18 acetylase RimI-like enzyme